MSSTVVASTSSVATYWEVGTASECSGSMARAEEETELPETLMVSLPGELETAARTASHEESPRDAATNSL